MTPPHTFALSHSQPWYALPCPPDSDFELTLSPAPAQDKIREVSHPPRSPPLAPHALISDSPTAPRAAPYFPPCRGRRRYRTRRGVSPPSSFECSTRLPPPLRVASRLDSLPSPNNPRQEADTHAYAPLVPRTRSRSSSSTSSRRSRRSRRCSTRTRRSRPPTTSSRPTSQSTRAQRRTRRRTARRARLSLARWTSSRASSTGPRSSSRRSPTSALLLLLA